MLLDAPVLALSAVDEEGTWPLIEAPHFELGDRAVGANHPAAPLVLADPGGFKVVLGAPVPGIQAGSSEARKG